MFDHVYHKVADRWAQKQQRNESRPSASPSLSPPGGSRGKKIYEDMKYSKGPEEAASAEARERN